MSHRAALCRAARRSRWALLNSDRVDAGVRFDPNAGAARERFISAVHDAAGAIDQHLVRVCIAAMGLDRYYGLICAVFRVAPYRVLIDVDDRSHCAPLAFRCAACGITKRCRARLLLQSAQSVSKQFHQLRRGSFPRNLPLLSLPKRRHTLVLMGHNCDTPRGFSLRSASPPSCAVSSERCTLLAFR